MASQHGWTMQVISELIRQGWKCRQGTRHIVIYPKDKKQRAFSISGSPSNMHARNMAIRQIRNAGGNIANLRF